MIRELSLAAAIALGSGVDCILGLAAERPVPGGPSTLERWALSAAATPGLEDLRAGAGTREGALAEVDERVALDAAQQRAVGLDQQRAGDLSDREIAIIAITAAVVLLLVIIF
jgi:hypothetical protein